MRENKEELFDEISKIERQMRRLAVQYEELNQRLMEKKKQLTERQNVSVVEKYKELVEETLRGVDVEDVFAGFSQGNHPDDVLFDGSYAPGFTAPKAK